MNCLDLRRALATNPTSEDEALIAHIRECDECASAFATSLRFERGLRAAVKIPAPENLASRILLRQSFENHSSESRGERRRWWRWPRAMAACIVLGIGLIAGGLLPKDDDHPGLDDDIVGLVRAAGYALAATTPLAPHKVKDALASVGLGLDADLTNVTFASRCYVRGKLAGHIVIQGQISPITVLLIPDTLIAAESPIESDDWTGRLIPGPKGTIAVVAAPGEKLEAVVELMQSAVRWKA